MDEAIWHPIVALGTTAAIFLTLQFRRGAPTDVLFLAGLAVVTLTGVITPQAALEGFAATDRFLFGSRPSLADFGLYGQLHTLTTDPTPRGIAERCAPRTVHWVRRLHDAAGVEGEWQAADAPLRPAVRRLLALAGKYYLPYLAANWAAIEAGEATFHVKLDGRDYRQPVFRYQAKCFGFLQRRLAGLPDAARAAVEPVLAETGCLPWLAAGGA